MVVFLDVIIGVDKWWWWWSNCVVCACGASNHGGVRN